MKSSAYTLRVERQEKNSHLWVLTGTVGFETVEGILGEFRGALAGVESAAVRLDLAGVTHFDSAGAAMILNLRRELQEKNSTLTISGANEEISRFLRLFDFDRLSKTAAAPPRPVRHFFEQAGEFILEVGGDLSRMLRFIGNLTLNLLTDLRHPGKIRWGEVAYLMQQAGAEALPIIALLSLLIGLVTAFSSAVQLRQFGANIFIADLVGIGMTRELGPLITAIILTGRSGSAFAAEIGTMKISEELDALTVMGIKPVQYLILPRMIAVMLVMPFLTLFADLFGILGGVIISIASLDLTLVAFLNQLQQAIGLSDVFTGVFKAFVFGVLVAGVGCYRGLETRGGALSVGRSTTASVVSGIFLIVVADSAFAIVLHYIHLG
jgi:phospholipid/cholesterol/gamma-HCH transport system permease protein